MTLSGARLFNGDHQLLHGGGSLKDYSHLLPTSQLRCLLRQETQGYEISGGEGFLVLEVERQRQTVSTLLSSITPNVVDGTGKVSRWNRLILLT